MHAIMSSGRVVANTSGLPSVVFASTCTKSACFSLSCNSACAIAVLHSVHQIVGASFWYALPLLYKSMKLHLDSFRQCSLIVEYMMLKSHDMPRFCQSPMNSGRSSFNVFVQSLINSSRDISEGLTFFSFSIMRSVGKPLSSVPKGKNTL